MNARALSFEAIGPAFCLSLVLLPHSSLSLLTSLTFFFSATNLQNEDAVAPGPIHEAYHRD